MKMHEPIVIQIDNFMPFIIFCAYTIIGVICGGFIASATAWGSDAMLKFFVFVCVIISWTIFAIQRGYLVVV